MFASRPRFTGRFARPSTRRPERDRRRRVAEVVDQVGEECDARGQCVDDRLNRSCQCEDRETQTDREKAGA